MYKLQKHDLQVLEILKDKKEHSREELIKLLNIDQAAIERAFLALTSEGLATSRIEKVQQITLTQDGKDALKNGLPEIILLKEIKEGRNKVNLISEKSRIIGLGLAKRKNFIEIENGTLKITKEGEKALKEDLEEIKELKKIQEGKSSKMIDLLSSRKLISISEKTKKYIKATQKGLEKEIAITDEISNLTPEMLVKGSWKNAKFKPFNIKAESEPLYPGKKHFVREVHDYIKDIWLSLGFKEMRGPLVVPSLLNFDALYSRQDHPARELHDTFYVKNPSISKLKKYTEEIKNSIKAVHENGGDTGSIGWRYKWSEEISKKNVLRTHTTSVSAETLIKIAKNNEIPSKYFSVGRCFRNETVDWKHSAEFFQTEGIVIDENANFRHLLWYLKKFFKKMGYENIRFRPAYYPYTELSVEPEAYNEERGAWVGLGGSGMFRPEVTKPLMGREIPVLAWGLGLDRIVMESHKLKDIRDLYLSNMDILRKSKLWMK